MSDTDSSKYDSESDCESEIIEEYSYINQIQNQSESESENESEDEEEEIKNIINERKVELLKIRKEKIEKIFSPNTERERKCLYSIAHEVDYIDIKPYSHNIIGLNLKILSEDEGYYEAKMEEK